MYRIRLHGRGGQGIKTGSRVLGSALFASGFEVQDAPLYGAERRGAPMSAYVRAAHAPIRERGLITRPDLVVVADETLIPLPAANVLAGVSARTVLLVRGTVAADVWRERLGGACGAVVTLAPAATAEDGAALATIGVECAGAAARLVGVIARDTLAQALRDEIRGRDESAIAQALGRALAAFDALGVHEGSVREGGTIAAAGYAAPEWIAPALDDVSVGAPDIHAARTSEQVRTGTWRTRRPVIDYDHCHRCSWICSTLCPDSAIDVDPDRTPHIDDEHCKGCMICVAVCPSHAIHAEPEATAGARP